ncbi:AAA family ATPase [Streptomyces sp. NPDC004610]|uniref:helix-turn-helix transcriptional regulator n=1 Tax=unclassified Streptomyces TaxID=2593676 RepID=UPI0033B849E9
MAGRDGAAPWRAADTPPGVRPGRLARRGRPLVDREAERERLLDVVESVRAGESRVLVLRGEPGIGKTALLDELADRAAPGVRVLRIAGVQSEMELAFAGLHQLSAPLLDRLESLPVPQREALRVAFGLSEGPPPDRFLIGLAVLGLLSEPPGDQDAGGGDRSGGDPSGGDRSGGDPSGAARSGSDPSDGARSSRDPSDGASSAAPVPLLCVVDDHQWLDRASAQALGFVARRLAADPVGMVFATRTPALELAGLPELPLAGLPERGARALLDSVLTGPLDARVRDQIVAETGGNPLALLELVEGLTREQLAGGFGLADAVPLPYRIEDGFVRRIEGLPDDTRRLLLLAAADPTGDTSLVCRAAGRMGVPLQAAGPAVEAGLAQFSARVWFRHPLLRSAVYRSAGTAERRAAHAGLGEATEARTDPDRRAWHLAQAASGEDETVAAELERSAGRARARGGPAAAAAMLEKSILLTGDPVRRGNRTLAAAGAHLQAGAYGKSLELLAFAQAEPLDALQLARLDLLRGQVAFASEPGRQAPPLLLRAARRLEGLDPALARETYLLAWMAAMFAGPATGGSLPEVSLAARALPPSARPDHAELLLDALSLMVTAGPVAAAAALRRAVDAMTVTGAFGAATGVSDASTGVSDAEAGVSDPAIGGSGPASRGPAPSPATLRPTPGTPTTPHPTPGGAPWRWLAHAAAVALWDIDSWRALLESETAALRAAGAFDILPVALKTLTTVVAWSGDLDAAAELITETEAVAEATGAAADPYGPALVAALRGDQVTSLALIGTMSAGTAPQDRQGVATYAQWTAAVLHNGLGHYDDALSAATRAADGTPERFTALWALPELIEAAVRAGAPERATAPMARLAASTRAGGTDAGLGIEARCRALLSEGEQAERRYQEAVDRLARSPLRPELGRAHLLYGEWLRRTGRRTDARAQLRAAHDTLTALGMTAFAERARRELAATGETVRRRTVETGGDLTPREALIARLARDGRTNQEIGTLLFISARTVEWHLRKVFGKLGVTSRRELGAALAGRADRLPPG